MIEIMTAPPEFSDKPKRRNGTDVPLLSAARGDKPSRRPVWFMRQAGRSLPEYRSIRQGIGMLEACFTPELVAEITVQPVRRHDVDAAIFFSDIVVPLKAAGIGLDIVPGRGPVMDRPVTSMKEISELPPLTPDQLEPISSAISLTLDELTDSQALIGFAGAPFTVASYLVEGGPSKTHARTKSMMRTDPEAWHTLMQRLTEYICTFLHTQIEAGIDAMQLFDSWAGYLSARDYRRYVAPYSRQIFDYVGTQIPRIHFGVTTGELLVDMAMAGPDVMGVDWRVDLADAAHRLAHPHSWSPYAAEIPGKLPSVLQGNIDPAIICAGREAIDDEVHRLVTTATRLKDDGLIDGHIVNLGHGVLPETDPDLLTYTVEQVHSL